MRIMLFTTLLTTLSFLAFSQEEVVTLIHQREIGLNSGTRAALGGKSRETIKIDLPENTVTWYYSFSTSSNGGGTKSLNLALQIASLLTSGISSELASLVEIPRGTGTADIYLLDSYNETQFRTKQDQALLGSGFRYIKEGTVENTKQALVQVDDVLSGTYYLGIRNPASVDAIFVTIEVVAIVNNSAEFSWTEDTKEILYSEFYLFLKEQNVVEPALSDLTNCMVESVVSGYSLSDFANLTEEEGGALEQHILESCGGLFEEENNCPEKDEAELFGSLGWTSFESGKIEDAINYSEKALEICSGNMGWVLGNLGFFALIQEDKAKAVNYYIKALKSWRSDKYGSLGIQAALDDIEKYKNQYLALNDCEEIISLLEAEK